MAKAAKQKIQNKEDEARKPEDDNVVAEAFDDANAAVGNDSYYADDGADTDYPPDEGDYNVADYSPDDGDDSPRAPLSKEQIQRLRQGGKRLKHPMGYLNFGDKNHSYDFVLAGVVVTGMKLIAITDWAVSNRELFFDNKPQETHGHRWIDCDGGIPPRPDTYTDRTKWEYMRGSDKKVDPWSINFVLPLSDESGGVVVFQAGNAATKRAIGILLADFDGRRPIVELVKVPDELKPNTFHPFFKVIGYAKTIEDFDFLQEMLIQNDPPYVKPEFGNF
jgi:hypothetical protein